MLKFIYGEESLYPVELERRYPRILDKIISMWGSPQMGDFFQELMVNSRTDRQGFPTEVVSEIYHLSEVYDETRNLPSLTEVPPLSQLSTHIVRTGKFAHSSQDFINLETASDDGPWERIDDRSKFEINGLGYTPTASGFLKAAGAKDLKALSLFMRCNINIDTCDERGWTPLIFAAFNGSIELVTLVLKLGASVNIKDNGGFIPLHWAAYNGHHEIIKILITNGADVHSRSLKNWTPLMMATSNGHLNACTALLLSGADTKVATHNGWTALKMASFNVHIPVIRLLLSLMKHSMQVVNRSELDD